MTIRLNKALSSLGICSRRDADELMSSGNVSVNKKLAKVGDKVIKGDIITVNGKTFLFDDDKEEKVWIYYKPVGIVTSHKDERLRKTVFEDIKDKIKERVISVGRLDINSEGLLLLTNNGKFARYAESPQTGWKRFYKVRIFGKLTLNAIQEIEKGVTINGFRYSPIKILSIKRNDGKNCWIECVLTEGKNREIRKILSHFDISVSRLIRYKYGPYDLGNLKPGEIVRERKLLTISAI